MARGKRKQKGMKNIIHVSNETKNMQRIKIDKIFSPAVGFAACEAELAAM